VPAVDPNVQPPQLSFHMSTIDYVASPGGQVKIVDVRQFPVTTISCALIEVNPGAIRELH
jgi:oxalate decarboxylase